MDRGFWRAIVPGATKSQARLKWLSNSSSSNALSYQKSRGCCSHADRTCCLASLHTACSQGVSSCHPGGEKPSLPVCRAHVYVPFLLPSLTGLETPATELCWRTFGRWKAAEFRYFAETLHGGEAVPFILIFVKNLFLFSFPLLPFPSQGYGDWPAMVSQVLLESWASNPQQGRPFFCCTPPQSSSQSMASWPQILRSSSLSLPHILSGNLVPLIKTLTSACTPASERDRFQLLDITWELSWVKGPWVFSVTMSDVCPGLSLEAWV